MLPKAPHIALLLGDIVDFGHMVKADPAAALTVLERYQRILDTQLARYQGELATDYFGPGCVGVFAKPADALNCALAIQQDFQSISTLHIPIVVDYYSHQMAAWATEKGQVLTQATSSDSLPLVFVSPQLQQVLSEENGFAFTPINISSLTGGKLHLVREKRQPAFPESVAGSDKQAWWQKSRAILLALGVAVLAGVVLFSFSLTKWDNSVHSVTSPIAHPPAEATPNMEAHRAVLEARQLIEIRTKEALEESIHRLDRALELEPEYAAAFAEKAIAQSLMVDFHFIDAQSGIEQAELNALTAIELDPDNDAAYAVLANVYSDQKKWGQAEAAYKIALQINPDNALVNYWYSLLLREQGRYDEAVQYGTIAITLDPLYPVIHCGHALTCIMAGRSDLAKKVLENGKVLFNDFFSYHWVWGYYYLTQKEYAKALVSYQEADRLNPDLHSVKRSLIFCQGRLGQTEKVLVYIQTQLGDTEEAYLGLANAYAGLQNAEKCVASLRALWKIGALSAEIRNSVKFDFLAGDPGFEALIREVEASRRPLD